jgi:hypothetical protein
MKTNKISLVPALLLMVSGFGQKKTIDLTFTAVDITAYVQLDNIKVMNRTQGTDTTIYWPDTTRRSKSPREINCFISAIL